jgi:hypothetical protein
MLDYDLAAMYGMETKVLKQAVKRNLRRFEGDDFMFKVTKEELAQMTDSLRSRSQFVTLNKGRGSNLKYMPSAFTELGVAMLSSVLNSDLAIEVNRAIMRAFVAARRMLAEIPTDRVGLLQQEVKQLKSYMDEILTDQNDINEDTRMQLELINQSLAAMQVRTSAAPHRPVIGFKPR